VAHAHREAVEQVAGVEIKLFKHRAELKKKLLKQRHSLVQSSAQAGFREHTGEDMVGRKVRRSLSEVAPKVKAADQEQSKQLSIANYSSFIFFMLQGLEQIIH